MGDSEQPPVGVVLAGGRARRLGGAKARLSLGGVPLLSRPVAALAGALPEVVVVAKPDTVLPELAGTPVWSEPAHPVHPAMGIRHALDRAGGRPILVCAGDMPFVTTWLIEELCRAARDAGGPVLASHDGRVQPLLGVYPPSSLAALEAGITAGSPMRRIVDGLDHTALEVGDERLLYNVNTPADLERAEALIAIRSER